MKLALGTVDDLWAARSSRERVLVGVMLGLLAATALWFAVVAPLRAGAESAALERAASAERLSQAEATAARIAALQARFGARQAPAALGTLIADSAAQNGVVLDRRQAEGATVTVWAAAADSKAFFGWLSLLQTRHGVGVTSLTAIPGEGGAIQIQAALSGPGG